jgi:hypothetical protein
MENNIYKTTINGNEISVNCASAQKLAQLAKFANTLRQSGVEITPELIENFVDNNNIDKKSANRSNVSTIIYDIIADNHLKLNNSIVVEIDGTRYTVLVDADKMGIVFPYVRNLYGNSFPAKLQQKLHDAIAEKIEASYPDDNE